MSKKKKKSVKKKVEKNNVISIDSLSDEQWQKIRLRVDHVIGEEMLKAVDAINKEITQFGLVVTGYKGIIVEKAEDAMKRVQESQKKE